jgi:hypothetical protein
MSSAASRRLSIVLIHGRDFKPAEASLRELWLDAIRAGLGRDRPDHLGVLAMAAVSLAYFGDATARVLQAVGRPYDEVVDMADRRNALKQLTALEARRFRRNAYERLPGKTPLKEFLADVGAPVAAVLHLTDWMARRVVPELAQYWVADSAYRTDVDRRVVEAIAAPLRRGDRLVVISHCIGSIAAYNAFWLLSRGGYNDGRLQSAKVDCWITLGSPLGDHTVKQRLLGAAQPRAERYPNCLLNWFNFAAEDDYTCHDETVGNDFRAMLQEHLISRIVDQRIYNLAVRYGRSNPHNAVGYLIHPRVIKVIADAIGGGSNLSDSIGD